MAFVLSVHYHRFAGDYKGWSLWIWPDRRGEEAREIQPDGLDEFGTVFHIPLDRLGATATIGLLPKFKNWLDKDAPDRLWQIALPTHAYILEGDDCLYSAPPPRRPQPRIAFVDSRTLVCVNFNAPLPVADVTPSSLLFAQDGAAVLVSSVEPHAPVGGRTRTFVVTIADVLDLEKLRTGTISVSFEGTHAGRVVPRYVLDDPYFFCDLPLGPYVDERHFFLRVWAPAAIELRAIVAATLPLPPATLAAIETPGAHPMAYRGRGVWELKLFGDFRNWHYRLDSLLVHTPDEPVSVFDPYARAISRQHHACILVDDHTPVAPAPEFPLPDAIVYELHVRDFTNGSGAGSYSPGTFAALAESGTRLHGYAALSTGIDHLRDLGVNTIQLMPVHACNLDEAVSKHAWGYMTIAFNALEPVFATDGCGATAVREFKLAIDALHRNGFKVVMDVVYNHSTENLRHAEHWNGLAPGFFYRAAPTGDYWNGSGCGNEFRSEAPMARKFLLDSLAYWVREYGVDGFRFDLMGLIDIATMRLVVESLDAVRPGLFIYGEPWTGGGTPIVPTSKGDQRNAGFSVFNDLFRNAVAGNVFDDTPGYSFDGRNRGDMLRGWCGSIELFAERPFESLNYVECHDNRTLADKIAATAAGLSPDDEQAVNRIAAFLVLLAQGVPFLHSGQEFARSKGGAHNSYDLGDAVNNIFWERKKECLALYEYYRGLARIRAAHPMFRLDCREEIERRIFLGVHRGPMFLCEIDGTILGDTWHRVVLVVNPTATMVRYAVPRTETQWHVHVAGSRADIEPLGALPPGRQMVEVVPRSALLLAEHMPPPPSL